MNLISINDLTRKEILALFDKADAYQAPPAEAPHHIKHEIGALLFFQPSTRTRVGFEAAAWKLGYKTILLDESKPSVSKGWSESMADTIRTMNAYVDFYCIRHDDAEIFDEVLPYTSKPVINCGNGHDEHPTQALIDAFAIWKKFNRLDDITVTFIGDTRYSRAAHSLVLLLSKFDRVTIKQITPNELSFPDEYVEAASIRGHVSHITIRELGDEDVLYSSGFPPINASGTFSQDIVRSYIVTEDVAAALREDAIIMNPLPRIDEIDVAVDASPKAYYFQQNEFGLVVRMAILEASLIGQ